MQIYCELSLSCCKYLVLKVILRIFSPTFDHIGGGEGVTALTKQFSMLMLLETGKPLLLNNT